MYQQTCPNYAEYGRFHFTYYDLKLKRFFLLRLTILAGVLRAPLARGVRLITKMKGKLYNYLK